MPLVTVKVVEGKTIEQKRALVKDITEAVVKDFEVPATAVTIDIVDLSRENLAMGGTLFADR
ncbi:2-hydroxymuconate tautomerase [Chloroflexota bacterium]